MANYFRKFKNFALVGVPLYFGLSFNSCNYNNLDSNSKIFSAENKKDSLIYEIDSINEVGWELKDEFPKLAIKAFEDAREKSLKINYSKGLFNSYNWEGILYRRKGDYEQSKSNYEIALKIAKKSKDSLSIAKVLNNLAVVFKEKGNYSEAVENYLEALKIYDKLGDSQRIARTYGNIGGIYFNQKNFDKALEYYRKDSAIVKSLLNSDLENISFKDDFSFVLSNIGMIFDEKEEYEKSIKYYFKALEISKEINNFSGQAILFNNIASYYNQKKDFKTAFRYFKEAVKINKKLGLRANISLNYLNMGKIKAQEKDFIKSLEYYKKSLEFAKQVNNLSLLMKIYDDLSEVYRDLKQPYKALECFEKYSLYKDSLFNLESSNQIADMETKYRTDKKEQENIMLKKDKELQETKISNQKKLLWGSVGAMSLISLLSLGLYRNYRNKKKANKLLAEQKEIIEEKNKDIMDSILYARNIQDAILPLEEEVKRLFPNSFVFYRPKDIVSGDFYWVAEKSGKSFFAACDCTGHGVPGAFTSMMSISFLNEALNKKDILKPNEIFDEVRLNIVNALKSSGRAGESKEGFDGVLYSIDKGKNLLEFACANNPLYIIRENKLIEFKADRMPVSYSDKLKPFSYNSFELKKGDLIYIFSDGYQDQFGGPKGKKFRPKQLKEFLISINNQPMSKQKDSLEKKILDWMKDEEQIDDILIIGNRFE